MSNENNNKPVSKQTTASTNNAAKPAAKPAQPKAAAKPAAKPAQQKTAAKPAAKPAQQKAAAKPAAKPAQQKAAAKPAAKPAQQKAAAKPAATKAASTKKKKTKKPKKKRRIWLRILLAFIIAGVLAVLAAGTYAAWCISTAPKIDTSELYNKLTESTVIYSDKGKKVDTIYSEENRTNISYDQLPQNLIDAFVALEDKTFWDHHGFNFIRIMGAIKNKLTSGGQVSGTSTITQQLARNVYLKDQMEEHSMRRKIVEAWYTVKLERNLSKKKILEAYLNTINLGFGSWGVESASQAYFNKHAKDLTLPQCAALASMPQAPTEYALVVLMDKDARPDPNTILHKDNTGVYVMNDAGKERRDTCLALMKEQGYITQEEYDSAMNTPLKKMLDPNYHMNDSNIAYFTDYVIAEVIEDLQEEKEISYDEAWDMVYKGGLRIHTTMDKKAQKIIQKEFKKNYHFPSQTNINYDSKGNILNKYGAVMLYKYSNYIKKKKFTFKRKEIKATDDGGLIIKHGKRLNIFETTVNGETDYSIEFPSLYKFIDGKLYSYSGGYINIPQNAKSKNDKGDIVISKEYVQSPEGKAMFRQKKNGKYFIDNKHFTVNQKVLQPQAAMTIIENKTGHIKAMVGGRKTKGKMLYNRAIEPRQPGSSIKPLAIYSAALQQSAEEAAAGKQHTFVDYHIDKQGTKGWGDWITAGSICIDEPTTNGSKQWPSNSGGGFSGYNTLRSAIRNSINTCAYKIYMQVGTDYSANMVKKYGISTLVTDTSKANDMNAAALALGGMTKGVTTLEMANAYTTFPNNGERAEEPICYTKVTNSKGKTILTKETKKVRVLDQGVAWIMADMMKGVVSGGTGTAAALSNVAAGGKTGTTSDQYDIWFDGFTPKYSASLWIGNDVNISLTSMSGYAAALWGNIMNQIPKANKGKYKKMPDNVSYNYGEYYVDGTYSSTGGYYWGPKAKSKSKKGSGSSHKKSKGD